MSTHSDIVKVKKKLAVNPDRFVRAFGLEVVGRIVMRTPVDTGRARANWHMSVDTPDSRVTAETDKQPPRSRPGPAKTLEFVAIANTAQISKALWITNGLPYIKKLEHGSSSQAAAGMVKVVVAELQPLADRIARVVERGRG